MITVTASFDDGSIYDLRVANIMWKHGIPTTFYIPVNWQKYLKAKAIEPLNDNQLAMILSEPLFDLGSHGVNHELLTKVDSKTQKYEIEESKKEFDARFGKKVEKFCYPRGYFNDDIKNIVKDAGYTSARTVKVGSLEASEDPYETRTTIHVGFDRKEYNGMDWFNFGRNLITQANALEISGKDVIFHFWGHSAEIEKYDQWDRLDKFVYELKRYLF